MSVYVTVRACEYMGEGAMSTCISVRINNRNLEVVQNFYGMSI